jgi:hypothetical protein
MKKKGADFPENEFFSEEDVKRLKKNQKDHEEAESEPFFYDAQSDYNWDADSPLAFPKKPKRSQEELVDERYSPNDSDYPTYSGSVLTTLFGSPKKNYTENGWDGSEWNGSKWNEGLYDGIPRHVRREKTPAPLYGYSEIPDDASAGCFPSLWTIVVIAVLLLALISTM